MDVKAVLVTPSHAAAVSLLSFKEQLLLPIPDHLATCSWIYQLATQTRILRQETEKQGATTMNTATKKLPRYAQTREPLAVLSLLTCWSNSNKLRLLKLVRLY